MIPRLTVPHRESREDAHERKVSTAAYHIERENWWSALSALRLAGNARQIVREAAHRVRMDSRWVEGQLARELSRVRNP